MAVLDNARHELFAQGLAMGRPMIEAYVKAGYQRNYGGSSHLNAKPEVQHRVRELLEVGAQNAELSVEKVLRELARIGFADVRELHGVEGRLLAIAELSDDIAAAIASYEVIRRVTSKRVAKKSVAKQSVAKKSGTTKQEGSRDEFSEEFTHRIKVWDKARALEMIGRYLAMFADKQRGADDPSAPVVEVEDVRRRLLDEVDCIASRLAAAAPDREAERGGSRSA